MWQLKEWRHTSLNLDNLGKFSFSGEQLYRAEYSGRLSIRCYNIPSTVFNTRLYFLTHGVNGSWNRNRPERPGVRKRIVNGTLAGYPGGAASVRRMERAGGGVGVADGRICPPPLTLR